MRKKKPDPLKVSFYGMNDRVEKLMVNSLKMLSSSIDTEVVAGIEGQIEIIDLDLSASGSKLLEDRLAQQPVKPIIVLSLHEISSSEVIFIKKPLQSADLSAALKKAKAILKKKASVNSIGSTAKQEKLLKTEKTPKSNTSTKPGLDNKPGLGNKSSLDNKPDSVNKTNSGAKPSLDNKPGSGNKTNSSAKPRLDTKSTKELPRKSKWTRGSGTGESEIISLELEAAPENAEKTVNVSKSVDESPRVVKWTRNVKVTDKNEENSAEPDVSPETKINAKDPIESSISLEIIDKLEDGYHWLDNEAGENSISDSREAKSVEFATAPPEKVAKVNRIKSGIDKKILEHLADQTSSENKQRVGKRKAEDSQSKPVEPDVIPEKGTRVGKVTKPGANQDNSVKHSEQRKDSEQKRGREKPGSKAINRPGRQKKIDTKKKTGYLSSAQPDVLIKEPGLEGDLVNRRKSVRYAFDDLKGYFVVNSLIMRNKRKSIQVLDISSKGAFFKCNSKLKIKTKGELLFDFGSATVYKIPAQVIRVDGKSGSYSLIFKEYNHGICDFLINSGRTFEIKTQQKPKTKRPRRESAGSLK